MGRVPGAVTNAVQAPPPSPGNENARPVLAVCGMVREAEIAAGPGVFVLQAGGSPVRLRTRLLAEDPARFSAVVSFGIAGGLHPELAPGAVIVATGIRTAGGHHHASPQLAAAVAGKLAAGGLHPVSADLFGAESAASEAAHKATLHSASGAHAIDMESHVAAEWADRAGLPFLALRVVCDPAHRGLPPLALDALAPDGTVRLGAVLRSLMKKPGQVAGLIRLARDSQVAFATLRRCRDLLGLRFGLGGVLAGDP